MQSRKIITLLAMAVLLLASVASAASLNTNANPAPQSGDISGKYEGVAKSDQIGDIPITVEIKNTGGKLSGKIESPQGPAPITSGTYADGKVTLKFDAGGNEGTVTATFSGDKITGKWDLGGTGGPLELKRVGAAGTTPAPKKDEAKPAPSGDPITGEWDASADVQGQSFPFTLKLKLDGDKVTGSSDSTQGSAPLSKGTWGSNKLAFTLDTPNGAIGFTATLKDGKLVGDFDFAGQMTGKWEAKKK
jgi:hypothetical protein